MMTRQGRRSPDDKEEMMMDAALKDAGMFEENMSIEDKRTCYNVLEMSKDESSFRLSTSGQPSPSQASPDHELRDSFSKLSTTKNVESADIFDDVECGQVADSNTASTSIPRNVDEVVVEERSRPRPSLSLKSTSERNMGRGRAKPIKYKYPSLPINAPGQKSTSSSNCTSGSHQDAESSIRPPDQSLNLESNLKNVSANQPLSSPQATSTEEIENMLLESPKQSASVDDNLLKEEEIKQEIKQEEELDVESLSPDERGVTVKNEKPSSPASVEDVGEDYIKEPPKTVQVGKRPCQVSPLENLLRPLPSCSISLFLKDLEQFKGDKTLWMKHAKEACRTARYAFIDNLLKENPHWGQPVSDTGYNNQTLFKQQAPSYSKLFSDRSTDQQVSNRPERQSKTQAISKISESTTQWAEPEYHSLRRLKQRDLKEDHSGNRPQRRKPETFIDDDDCVEYPSGSSGEIWPVERTEQKKKTGDSDSEASPDSPNISHGLHDPYEFPGDDNWNTATSKNKNKNNKKGGKQNQGDIEVECKQPARIGTQTPAQRGRHSKTSRVQKGAISRPSEHATPGNNARNRGASADQSEDTNSKNNNRWLTSNHNENSSDIPTQKFYPPKVSQPRNPPSMLRKNSRESKSPEDFLGSPSSSGALYGRHQDGQSEEAAVERRECPICFKNFPATEIEAHSSGCNDWQGGAQGEKLLDENQSKGGSDKIAKVTGKGELSSSDGENQSACDQCNLLINEKLLANHTKECKGNLSAPPSGLKRGNSPERDDGPAKKSTRLVL
ncbi:formin-J isoform X2 [Frankliniella occidentalis]|nr:formin-J isoform X2 [Frankliniella occidentalis]